MKWLERIGKRLNAGMIALLYAAMSAVWILVSGALLIITVSDTDLHQYLEIGKGLVFVLVSAILLYVLLREWQRYRLADQQRMQAVLRQQHTVLNATMAGIVQLRSRVIVMCNRRAEEILGYGPGELIGQSTRILYPDEDAFTTFGARAYLALTKGENISEEIEFRRKDSSPIHGVLCGQAIDPAQPQEGSVWSFVDVSKDFETRQQARKMLQAVEQSPVSIVITDLAGNIEYVNPAFCSFTGYTAAEVIGQNPRILKSEESAPELYQELWQTLQKGRNWKGVFHNRKKNGELFWESATISPIFDEQGQVTHYLAVKEDISERKRFVEELERYRSHLEETVRERTVELSEALEAALLADRVKDQFLANVSHELRTPLNVVIGLADLAQRSSSDAKQSDYLGKIANAGKNLAGIINDLLDLSKIAAGHLEFEAKAFSLRHLLERSLFSMTHKAEEKGLLLSEQIDASVPDKLVGDPLRIEQILLNLISNAIKFTPSGRIDIRIGLQSDEASEENRVGIVIEVADTGIGISAAELENLFQPFAQADASITRKFGGTGLGLVICKRLAEMMEGSIEVSSEKDKGSVFRVMLRLGISTRAEEPDAESTIASDPVQVHYRNVRILVVDDQPTNLEIAQALLVAVGITPHLASNGKEAIAQLKAAGGDAFDLVLMDIQMPVMDGLAATRAIRNSSEFSDLPVIALTAHTMEHEKKISAAAGVNDHIGKPFDTTDFYRTLAKWIPRIKQTKVDQSGTAELGAHVLPRIQGLDADAGLSRFIGNTQRYRQWLMNFVAEAPDLTLRLRQMIASEDREAALATAHAIKGRVSMLGMNDLQAQLAALETALKHGQPVADALEYLEKTAKVLSAEIRQQLGE